MAVLVAEEDGMLLGVLPLAVYRGGFRDAFARVLEFSGGTQADTHDLIAEPSRVKEVLDAFSESFETLCHEVGLVRLHNMLDDSHLLNWAEIANHVPDIEETPLPFLAIETPFDNMARQWTRSHRGDVRRQTRRLEKLDSLSLEHVTDCRTAKESLDKLLVMLASRWSDKNQSATQQNEQLGRYLASVIENMWPSGNVHFSILRSGDRPISYHIGFLYGGRLYWYRPTFDIEFENYSPGKVHIGKLLEIGCDEGWNTFDFLLGDESYKHAWSNGQRRAKTLTFTSGSLVGKVGGWSARTIHRRVIPMLRTVKRTIIKNTPPGIRRRTRR